MLYNEVFEETLDSKNLSLIIYEISESLNEYSSILKRFIDMRFIDPSNKLPRIIEPVETISEDFNRCIGSIKYNIKLVKRWLEKGFPDKELEDSNYNMILLSGAYSDAYNSYSWMKEPFKSQVTPYQERVRKQMDKLKERITKYNEKHDKKLLTMEEALEEYKKGPIEYLRKTFKDK